MRGKRLLLAVLLLAPTLTAARQRQDLAHRAGATIWSVASQRERQRRRGGRQLRLGRRVLLDADDRASSSTGGVGAASVSRDGRTIVGTAIDSRVFQAAIWLRAAEWKLLGSFRPGAAPCGASLSGAHRHEPRWTGRGRSRVGRLQPHACVPVGRVDGHGGPREFRRGTSQSRERRVGRRQGRGRLPGGCDRLPPGRAVGGRPAGIVSRVRKASSERRRPRTATARSSVGRICAPSATETRRCQLSERLGVDDGGTARSACPPRACVPRPVRLIIVEANATSDDGRVIGGGQNVGGSDDSNAIIWIDGVSLPI